MQRLYVVIETQEYEFGYDILGVFDSLELAKQNYPTEYKWNDYEDGSGSTAKYSYGNFVEIRALELNKFDNA